jgi:hypothetical protein
MEAHYQPDVKPGSRRVAYTIDSAPPPAVRILEFHPHTKNSLRGFLRAELSSGLIIADVALHYNNGRFWCSPPARPWTDKATGQPVIDSSTGRARWTPLVDFTSKELRNAWSDSILAALRRTHPDALLADDDEPLTPWDARP